MLMRLFMFTGAALGATIKINIGQSGLTFTPDSVTAAKNDVLEFHFVGGNHDAVSSDYAKPCEPLPGSAGFSSGAYAGSASNNNVFRVTVNSTEPMYYYCSVGAHCANGMVAAINPAADKTVAAYKTAAKGKTSKRPSGVYGGTMGTA